MNRCWFCCSLLSGLVMLLSGCGSTSSGAPQVGELQSSTSRSESSSAQQPAPAATKKPPDVKPRIPPAPKSTPAANSQPLPKSLPQLAPPAADSNKSPSVPALPNIDDAAVLQLGIRKLSGKHLLLYTDLPADSAIDELPRVFDAAVPSWCDYFAVPEQQATNWRVVGYIMQDKDRFRRAGLLPDNLPEFLHGFHRGAELWLYEQPSRYYRRHLLLHEGTHAFMMWSLGGAGPPWYMEGTAELFATHHWQDGKLTLRYFPADKEEVPQWGRIKIVKDDILANRGKTLMDVLNYDSRAHLRVEPYGWCWAAAAFFDNHPTYQQRFRDLRKYARDAQPTFSQRFLSSLADDSQQLWREWQWFVVNIEYGYDIQREAFQSRPAASLPAVGATVEIAADRGWQSTGTRLEAGKSYRIEASGRYQIGKVPKVWLSEPNGVTIRYHHGQPLGILLGAVVDEADAGATDNGFLQPAPIGLGLEITPPLSGTLYLRINDSPAELFDNQGTAKVRISESSKDNSK